MKNVAIYIRVSTDEQASKGNSLNEQEERLRAYCRAMDWDDVEVFKDDGYSAGTMKRPELTRMISMVRDGKFQMVVTTKIDRLCRNLLDLLTIVDEFDSLKCGYASASESFDTSTSAGRMVLQILGAFAEFERGRTRERIRENMRSIVMNTDKAVSRPCFGYDIVDGRMKINEKEADIVRQMAEWMLQGEGAHRVMRRLNALGIKTKDGNSFTQQAVGKLMHRETLAGMFVYNRQHTPRGGKSFIRPKEEWLVIENHHEPILTKETFDRLQSVINARKTSGKQADNDRWLLSGLVRCTHCNAKMTGRHKRKPSGREYFHYVCSSYLKKAECFHHFINRDTLELTVLDQVKKANEILEMRTKEKAEPKAIDLDEIESLNKTLKKLNVKMQKQIELYENDEIEINDFRSARDRINAERNGIIEQINEAEADSKEKAIQEFMIKVNSLSGDLNSVKRSVVKNALRQVLKTVKVTNAKGVEVELLV